MTIHKFQLRTGVAQMIETPRGPIKPLALQLQGGWPTLWAVVSSLGGVVKREVRMLGTGWEFKEHAFQMADYEFIGTVQMPDGLVWHYFLKKECE